MNTPTALLRWVMLTLAASALLAQSAIAADLGGRPPRSIKDEPYDFRPVVSWSGLYIGAHVGYGWSDVDWQGVSNSFDTAGWLGGAQVGYNWQQGAFVFGIEGDLSTTNISGDSACPGLTCNHDINWLASIRGRAGFTTNSNRTLFYATAGGAWADIDYAAAGFGSFSQTHFGWVAGAGIEHMLTPNLSARVEYLFYGFDGVTAPAGVLASGPASVDPSLQTVRFGLNFKY